MANREYTIKLDIAFHPGEMLEEKLQEMAMPVNSFAEQSKVPESIVRDIIHGDASSISPGWKAMSNFIVYSLFAMIICYFC